MTWPEALSMFVQETASLAYEVTTTKLQKGWNRAIYQDDVLAPLRTLFWLWVWFIIITFILYNVLRSHTKTLRRAFEYAMYHVCLGGLYYYVFLVHNYAKWGGVSPYTCHFVPVAEYIGIVSTALSKYVLPLSVFGMWARAGHYWIMEVGMTNEEKYAVRERLWHGADDDIFDMMANVSWIGIFSAHILLKGIELLDPPSCHHHLGTFPTLLLLFMALRATFGLYAAYRAKSAMVRVYSDPIANKKSMIE